MESSDHRVRGCFWHGLFQRRLTMIANLLEIKEMEIFWGSGTICSEIISCGGFDPVRQIRLFFSGGAGKCPDIWPLRTCSTETCQVPA